MSYIKYEDYRDFAQLVGLTLTRVEKIDDERIEFDSNDGRKFVLMHTQDCCEAVTIESIVGDLSDLVGEPILVAEEVSSGDWPSNVAKPEWEPESFTWTFYKLATRKGYVDIRWYGESNGYYSESVDFGEIR